MKLNKSIGVFAKNNKIISLLLFISIIVILKLSTLPYPFAWTSFDGFLNKPIEGSTSYELWRILENISLAYVASIIFYILVDYIPKKKLENNALDVMSGYMTSLFFNMAEIIYSFKCVLNIETKNDNISLEELTKINTCEISNQDIYIKEIVLNNKKHHNTQYSFFNPYKDFIRYGNSINKLLEKLNSLPCIIFSDSNLLKIISSIQTCSFLSFLLRIEKDVCIKNGIHVEHYGLNEHFLEFIRYFEKLREFPFNKCESIKIKLDENEIIEYKKFETETIQNDPQFFNLLEKNSNENYYIMFNNHKIHQNTNKRENS